MGQERCRSKIKSLHVAQHSVSPLNIVLLLQPVRLEQASRDLVCRQKQKVLFRTLQVFTEKTVTNGASRLHRRGPTGLNGLKALVRFMEPVVCVNMELAGSW